MPQPEPDRTLAWSKFSVVRPMELTDAEFLIDYPFDSCLAMMLRATSSASFMGTVGACVM